MKTGVSQDFRVARSLRAFLPGSLHFPVFPSRAHPRLGTHQKSYFIKSATLLPATLLIPLEQAPRGGEIERE